MDNKQDRQFFWNVKDFLAKSPQPTPFKPVSAFKDTATKVMTSTPNVAVPVNEIINSSSKTKTMASDLLNAFNNIHSKEVSSNPAHAKNVTTNLFNLHEMNGGSISKLPQPAGVLTKDQTKYEWTPFEEISEEEVDTEKMDTGVINLAGKDPSKLNYVDLNLNLGPMNNNTIIPGTKPVGTAPSSSASSSAPKAPSITANPIPEAGVKAPNPDSFKTQTVRMNVRPQNKSNEILYGRSVKAYR